MTIIVAYKDPTGIWMGADARASDPSEITQEAMGKVFAVGPFTIGFSGSFRFGQVLRFWFNPPAHPPKMDTDTYMVLLWVEALRAALKEAGMLKSSDGVDSIQDGGGLVAYKRNIYTIQGDLSLLRAPGHYAADGSGSSYALGVMHALKGEDPEQIVRRALAAACEHSPACGGPLTVLRHGPEPKPKPRVRRPR